jgi:secondary thiamine-phosphate synthase enzyme
MPVKTKTISIKTTKQFELIDVTKDVREIVASSGIREGSVCVFAPHTTASIRINHSEPLLFQDIMKLLYRLVPMDISYAHDFFEIRTEIRPDERSNGHAHVKAFLLGSSETIPMTDGKLALGERQSIFFVELDGGRDRRMTIQIQGE